MHDTSFDHLARLLGGGADRRTLIRGLAGGAIVGGGLLPAATAHAAPGAVIPRPQDEPQCGYLVVFSKKLDGFQIGDPSCEEPCGCPEHKEVVTSHHTLSAEMFSAACDESIDSVPDKSALQFKLTHHLKFSDQGPLVGYHDGTFDFLSSEGNHLMSGRLEGTDGLNSEIGDCDEGRLEGHLDGEQGSGPFEGCTLVGEYRFRFKVDQHCPDNWSASEGILTGVFRCPCPDGQ
jgi:hypothetical protein